MAFSSSINSESLQSPHGSSAHDMIFFTICSRNFMGYSNALYRGVSSTHPKAKFYAVICDDERAGDPGGVPYEIITLSQLGIPNIEAMLQNYNITELNTSLKPFAFMLLFDRHEGLPVIYLDPDIMVLSRLQEVEQAFDAGAHCILTPHLCEPAEYAEMDDKQFLKYGIYNLGFCAFVGTEQVKNTVSWWARRLERYCIIDLKNGIFVDQKWADYFPAFIEKTAILRHPGYNVAYWNLSQRRLARKGEAWTVNGAPLRFFHFSGNEIANKEVFTRHSKQFTPRNTPELRNILDQYRTLLYDCGHEYYSKIPYSFSWSGPSGFNEHTPEKKKK
ncbi:hypothetical protein [Methylobacterium sp. 285MFTsu5.1]|uniref:hypothetical protein n=1 Tax=Methylobacterium sp. 285MFTsu5.1 TaxID=1172187 RepID=UPI0003A612E7|nr:hypothetical protein [Methylobacterium sp. 285MFTsu5.1]